jgi:hypothetical protein
MKRMMQSLLCLGLLVFAVVPLSWADERCDTPTVSVDLSGSRNLTVNVGDPWPTVNWFSGGGMFSSSYSNPGGSASPANRWCNLTGAWGFSTSGSHNLGESSGNPIITQEYAGCVRTFTYVAYGAGGSQAVCTATLTINPPAPPFMCEISVSYAYFDPENSTVTYSDPDLCSDAASYVLSNETTKSLKRQKALKMEKRLSAY